MVAPNPLYAPLAPLSNHLHPVRHQRSRARLMERRITPASNRAIAVRKVKGSGPACDFLVVSPVASGGLAVAIGTMKGPSPQTRSACTLAFHCMAGGARRRDFPARLLGRLHSRLARWNDLMPEPGLHCSAVCCLFDFRRGMFHWANADHRRPVVWTRTGQRLELGGVGEAVGVSFLPVRQRDRRTDELCIEERQVPLGELGRVLLHTEGVVEAAAAYLKAPADSYLSDLLEASSGFPIDDQLETLMAGTIGRPMNPPTSPRDVTLFAADVTELGFAGEAAATELSRWQGL